MKIYTAIKPELLQHPNIPKPLHGMAPRVIKGQDWWDVTRQEAYASTDYHCLACGVHKSQAQEHQWLEAHEDYDIDYEKGIMKVNQIIPLCHYCHNFIHSGRLWMVNRHNNIHKIKRVLEHGIRICEKHSLDIRYFTAALAETYDINHTCDTIEKDIDEVNKFAEWSQWHLILDGDKYYSRFKDQEEWQNYYSNK